MDDEKIKFTRDAIVAIRARTDEFKKSTGRTWKAIAADIGVGESTLTNFMAEKYGENGNQGDLQSLVEKIANWFRAQEEQREMFRGMLSPGFVQTRTAEKIWALLQYAQMGNMCTLIGAPGLGKTLALKRFVERGLNVYMSTSSPERATSNPFFKATMDSMGGATYGSTASELSNRIRALLGRGTGRLWVIDESQHMSLRVIEEVRAIHDETGAGIIFCGNEQVARVVEGNRTAQFAQITRRISKRVVLHLPEAEDIRRVLESWDVRKDEEARFLGNIAMIPGGGALGQMVKVLQLASLMANAAGHGRGIADLKEAYADLTSGIAA